MKKLITILILTIAFGSVSAQGLEQGDTAASDTVVASYIEIPDMVYTKKQFVEDAEINKKDRKYREVRIEKKYPNDPYNPTEEEKKSTQSEALNDGKVKFIYEYADKWFEHWKTDNWYKNCSKDIEVKYTFKQSEARVVHDVGGGVYAYSYYAPYRLYVYLLRNKKEDSDTIAIVKNIRCYK